MKHYADSEMDDEKDNVTSQEKAQGKSLLTPLTGTDVADTPQVFTEELMRRTKVKQIGTSGLQSFYPKIIRSFLDDINMGFPYFNTKNSFNSKIVYNSAGIYNHF